MVWSIYNSNIIISSPSVLLFLREPRGQHPLDNGEREKGDEKKEGHLWGGPVTESASSLASPPLGAPGDPAKLC